MEKIDDLGKCVSLSRNPQGDSELTRKLEETVQAQRKERIAAESARIQGGQREVEGRVDVKSWVWRVALILAGWCLVLTFADFPALWPYQVSRWLICGGSIWLWTKMPEGWRQGVMIAVAIAFNPVLPIHFGKAWPVVDVLAAVGFVSLFGIPISKSLIPCLRIFGKVFPWVVLTGAFLLIVLSFVFLSESMDDVGKAKKLKKETQRERDMKAIMGNVPSIWERMEKERVSKNKPVMDEFMHRLKEETLRTGKPGTAHDGSRIMREVMQERGVAPDR